MILGIPDHMFLKLCILHQRHIRRQHHQALRLQILILPRSIPLLPPPLLTQQQTVIIVRDNGGGERPGAVEAGAVSVTAAEGVRAGEGHDFPVVEAHPTEDGA